MIELSNTAEITVAPGQAAVFDRIVNNSDRCCCSRNFNTSSSIKMTNRGTYQLNFSGNITGATAATPVQLSIAVGGASLPQTTMISTPTAAGDFNNVAKTTYYENECNEFSRATVVNTGTTPVIIGAGATFSVVKVRC